MRRADVLLHNFRPGVMERLGLDHRTAAELNPGLVYASASGYGADGPWARRPGQDLLAQSVSALPWVNAIVRAVATGWVMLLGAFVCSYYFIVDDVSDDAGLVALLLVLLLIGAVVGLLLVVMRALLRQATTLRTDMEAVI